MNNERCGDLETAKTIGETLLFSLSEEQKIEFMGYMLNYVDTDKLSSIREDREKERVQNLLKLVKKLRPSTSPSLETAKAIALQHFDDKARFDEYLEYTSIEQIELIHTTMSEYQFLIHYVDTDGTCLDYEVSVERKKQYLAKVR